MRTIRQHTRQARARLLWGVCGFVLFQLALDAGLEGGLPQVRNPNVACRTERLQQKFAENGPAGPLVVMLGTSRTQWGLDAILIETELAPQLGKRPVVFNFGIPGGASATHLVVLHELLRQGIRPDLLLVEVMPAYLRDEGPVRTIDELTADRLLFGEIALLERCGFAVNSIRNAWWTIRAAPWYSYRANILQALAPEFAPLSVQDRNLWMANADSACWWRPPAQSSDRHKYTDRAREDYTRCLQGIRIGGPHCQALREVLETCRRQKVRCALVLMPEGTEFQSWYPAETWRQVLAFLDDLIREYAVPVINARDWVSDEDFWDQHHLLLSGARVFSDRLAKEAILPLLRETRDHRLKPVAKGAKPAGSRLVGCRLAGL